MSEGGGWSDARVSSAKQMWLDGRSATEIAVHLGNVTRNAVLGKLSRLHLLGGKKRKSVPKNQKTTQTFREKAQNAPPKKTFGNLGNVVPFRRKSVDGVSLAPAMPKTLPPAPQMRNLLLHELTRTSYCRWPLWGDERAYAERFYCAADAGLGTPYCAFHNHASRGAGTPSERAAVKQVEKSLDADAKAEAAREAS